MTMIKKNKMDNIELEINDENFHWESGAIGFLVGFTLGFLTFFILVMLDI